MASGLVRNRFSVLPVLPLIAATILVPSPTKAEDQGMTREAVAPAPHAGVTALEPGSPPPGSGPGSDGPALKMPEEGSKDPASGIELHGLMWMLYGAMRGQRVVAMNQPQGWRSNDLSGPEYRQARTLIEKLQVIAASQSDDSEDPSPWNLPMIPFKVGNAYAIAPETRESVNPNLTGLSALDASSRGTLLMDALLHIPPRQIAALGSESGVAISSLPREIQALLERSFRPPLKIMDLRPSTYTDESGTVRPSWEYQPAGNLDAPLDFSQVRIRANLRLYGVNVQVGSVGSILGAQSETPGLAFMPSNFQFRSYEDRGADIPLFEVVPNTYKPSDLEGRRFTQPIGISGVWKVEDVVKRISRNTGLKLQVWSLYRGREVFIGAPEITSGEMIDALRLCLTASWRKLGDSYLLAWDRLPIQAVQLLARESSASVATQVRKHRTDLEMDPNWLQLVSQLRFAADDPLALTAEQRAHLFPTEPSKDKDRGFREMSLPFTELTPEQQAYIRKQAETDTIDLPEMGPENPAVKRPYTEEDLRGSSLEPQGVVVVSISVPGKGWVRATDQWDGLSFHGWQLQRVANKAGTGPQRDILDDAPPEVRQMLADMKPMPLPSSTRAAIVPVLGVARLNTLADEMKHRGLNVLFYPALFGGYATFSSKAFPLHPALRGEDGLAAAMAAMKAKGIQVVPYLNTLAWQNASDKVHWLSKYPQWMDLDVLGRSRAQWAQEHPDAAAMYGAMGIALNSYVRPTEPMVEARLKALLAEVAARPGAAGVAFGEWAPSAAFNFPERSLTPPALGFSLADRYAAFLKTGQDPADAVTWSGLLPSSIRQLGIQGEEQVDSLQAHSALVKRLLDDAKARHKDWTTYLIDDSGSRPGFRGAMPAGPSSEKLSPDVRIHSLFSFLGDEPDTKALLFPISTKNFFSAMSEIDMMGSSETVPKQLLDLPSIAVYNLMWNTESRMKTRTLSLVALDFRYAPEAIDETLKWVQPPGQVIKPAAAQPRKAPTPAPKQAPVPKP